MKGQSKLNQGRDNWSYFMTESNINIIVLETTFFHHFVSCFLYKG